MTLAGLIFQQGIAYLPVAEQPRYITKGHHFKLDLNVSMSNLNSSFRFKNHNFCTNYIYCGCEDEWTQTLGKNGWLARTEPLPALTVTWWMKRKQTRANLFLHWLVIRFSVCLPVIQIRFRNPTNLDHTNSVTRSLPTQILSWAQSAQCFWTFLLPSFKENRTMAINKLKK